MSQSLGWNSPLPEDDKLYSSEVLVTTCQTTRRYDKSENYVMSLHRYENLKYYTVYEISTLFSLLETNNI